MSATEGDILHPSKSNAEKEHARITDVELDVDVDDVSMDAAGRFLAQIARGPDADALLAPYTPEEERALVRKADFIILPMMLIALMMGAVDKVALGTAAVLGLRTDLHLVGQQYSWSSSIIFFGSLPSVFPALFLLQRYQTGKVISANVIVWGIISMCHAATKSFGGLAACRFMLGFFEALTFPGFTLVLASWYTREEAVVRTAIVFSTLSSLTNGLLSYACSYLIGHHLQPWQLLFILVGLITFITGAVMMVFLPDAPYQAWWLTPRQRVISVRRLQGNKIGVMNKQFKFYQFKEAMLDPKTWIIFLINICLNVPNSGILTFYSIIIASLGFSTRNAALMSVPTGFISYFSSLGFSYIAIKTRKRCFTAIAACVVPLLATILLHTIPRSNVPGSIVSLMLVYFFWAPYVVMITVVAANTGGYTKKTTAYGVAYCGYLVGNIIGPQAFKAKQAPKYTGGVVAMLVCYCIAILLIAVYYVYVRLLQRRATKHAAAHPEATQEDSAAHEWRDETDKENPAFTFVI